MVKPCRFISRNLRSPSGRSPTQFYDFDLLGHRCGIDSEHKCVILDDDSDDGVGGGNLARTVTHAQIEPRNEPVPPPALLRGQSTQSLKDVDSTPPKSKPKHHVFLESAPDYSKVRRSLEQEFLKAASTNPTAGPKRYPWANPSLKKDLQAEAAFLDDALPAPAPPSNLVIRSVKRRKREKERAKARKASAVRSMGWRMMRVKLRSRVHPGAVGGVGDGAEGSLPKPQMTALTRLPRHPKTMGQVYRRPLKMRQQRCLLHQAKLGGSSVDLPVL